jgi:predicted nucleic acid-binding protein
MILNTSLDTSFWNIASQIGVIPYVFTFFRVHYCQSVESEIVTTDPDETPLIYPQAMLFKVMQEDGRLHRAEPERPLSQFGAGEANAIALAREREWILLINDYRPLQLAKSLNIQCVSVPDFCVFLYAEQKITYRAVKGYLHRLASTTSPKLLRSSERIADEIARKRGEQ